MARDGELLSTVTYSSTGWSKVSVDDTMDRRNKSIDVSDDDRSPGKSLSIPHTGMSNSSGNNSMGSKIINFTCKIFKVLIISAVIETDPLILQELLECSKVLLEEIPLLSLSTITGSRIKCLVNFEILAMRFFKVIYGGYLHCFIDCHYLFIILW